MGSRTAGCEYEQCHLARLSIRSVPFVLLLRVTLRPTWDVRSGTIRLVTESVYRPERTFFNNRKEIWGIRKRWSDWIDKAITKITPKVFSIEGGSILRRVSISLLRMICPITERIFSGQSNISHYWSPTRQTASGMHKGFSFCA